MVHMGRCAGRGPDGGRYVAPPRFVPLRPGLNRPPVGCLSPIPVAATLAAHSTSFPAEIPPVTARRCLPVALLLAAIARADGPADNLPDKVRRIPPPGVAVPADVRAELAAGVVELGREIEGI